jgi:ABC-2 type transport system permease protein
VKIVIPQFNNHPIVDKLLENHIDAFIPFSRSVETTTPVLKNVTQTVLLQTTDKGWGEMDLKAKQPSYSKGSDIKGPRPLAVACEWLPAVDNPSQKTRLVVFGGSNFLTNQFLTGFLAGPGNLDIALNSFSWAAVEENKITIHPKEEDNRVLNLTNVSAKVIFYTVVVLLPLAALAAGILIWYRRRSL